MKNITIKEYSEDSRPMEKLQRYGSNFLTDYELLAILIGSGTAEYNAIELANYILNNRIGKRQMFDVKIEELMQIKGIGLSKATRIIAGLTLGKRLSQESKFSEVVFNRPETVAEYLYDYFLFDDKEKFCTILLDSKNRPIANELISVGTLNSSLVHPREVFKPAIKKSANSMILAHNHPSGEPNPSKEDVAITKRLIECGELIGIKVLDHIVVGDRKYISILENNYI